MTTGPTLSRVVASEWLKLRTLRSFRVGAGAAVVLAAGGAVLRALSHTGASAADVLAASSSGLQIALVVLAVLVPGVEYTGGAIRVTLLAVPRRRLLMTAKTLLVTAGATVLATLSLIIGYVATLPLPHRGEDFGSAYGTMSALLIVEVGSCVLVALFAFAVTLLVRNTAAAAGLTLAGVLLSRMVLFVLDMLVWGA